MRKRITVDELGVGMYVAGLDKPWMETAAFRHRMTITDAAQVQALKRCGVQCVDIETVPPGDALGAVPVPVDQFAHAGPELAAASVTCEPTALPKTAPATTVSAEKPSTSFDEELPLALAAYADAKGIVQRAMFDVRMGREINTDAVGKVVDGLVDSVLRNADALTSLSRLKSFDEYTFFHSVNTSVLALALGRNLSMDRETLHVLGCGTLLHDIGKMAIPLEILNKPGRYAPDEYEVMKQHALRGADLLRHTTGLREGAIRPALEHHERMDGTGYPFGRTRAELTQFGLIGSVVDIYDAMTSDRVYHKAMPPYQALQFVFKLSREGHLDPDMVQRFIKCVSVYPVGSCVALTTNEIAIVTQVHSDRLLMPKVLIVQDAESRACTPWELDLAEQLGQPVRAISLVLDPVTVGIEPSQHLATPTL